MAVDIREVARLSGVSMATVSRALNGRPDVSPATREKVEETARRLGYMPNQQARALVRGRSDMVGLIWDTGYVETKGRQPFLSDMLVALKMAFADTGYHLMLLSPRTTDVEAFVRAAAQHGLDGVALMGVNEHLPAVDALIASGRPCVGIDLPVRGRRATYVTSDNRHAATVVVAHLHELGHRRIATITGPTEMMPSAERLVGYRAEMARLGLEVPPGYVAVGDFFRRSGYSCMRELLALPDPPTAVFAAGDDMAIGAMQAISEAGLQVPADISVVGYDDIEISALIQPALTTVSQDYLALGRAAVLLLERVMDLAPVTDGPAPESDNEVLAPLRVPGHLILRASSGPAPTRDPLRAGRN